MYHVGKISGGESSGFLMEHLELKKKHDGWNVVYIYNETGQEADETYEYLKKLAEYYRTEIICLKPMISNVNNIGVSCKVISLEDIGYDKTIIGDLFESYGTMTVNARFCTSRMKSEPTAKYCNATFGKGNYKLWLGIRADEKARLKSVDKQYQLFLNDCKKKRRKPDCEIGYLADLVEADKEDVKNFWESMPFRLEIHDKPFLGNCLYCPQKENARIALAARYYPERAEEFIEQCKSGQVVNHNRKSKDGIILKKDVMYRSYLSLEEVIDTYKDIPTDELENQIKRGNRYKEVGCGVSCIDMGQLDLFDAA